MQPPEITLTEQRYIPDTGYLLLKGAVSGLKENAELTVFHNDTLMGIVPVSFGSSTLWQFENLEPVKLDNPTLRLTLEDSGQTLCGQDVPLRQDQSLVKVLGRLRESHTVKLFGFDGTTHTDNPTALKTLEQSSCTVVRETFDPVAFKAWMEKVDYETTYPKYVKEFPPGGLIEAKAAQHYVSILLSDPNTKSRFMDTASSNSPFWQLLVRWYGVRASYRQDLNFKPGVHGDTVGSNVTSIPFEDDCLTMITAHCSWEHFEGEADVEYFRECARILKPGGVLVIVPLYFVNEYSVHTSPHIWDRKYTAIGGKPDFDNNATVYLREEICQRMAKFYTGPDLIRRILRPFSEKFDFSLHYYVNYQNVTGCPAFALLGVRRA